LRSALDAARRGRGCVALVRGEPGIGKSAIVKAIAEEAQAAGVQVVEGRAWELAEAPPYFPLWPCFRELGISAPADGTSAFRLWEDVLAALARHATNRPLTLVLEDLHAADLQSLDLLTFLVQPLRALNVLVVGTARAQDPRIGERAEQRLVRIARDGLDVRLEPLGGKDVGELAARIVGRPLPPKTVQDLVALTGGNPLFVVECARAFRAAGAAPVSAIGLPATIRQVVTERIALLPEDTQHVLEAAAILGREAAAGTVARMQSMLPANVIDALVPAVAAGIVAETRPGHFAFTHILVRDAIEDRLAPSDRAELHARAGVALGAAGDAPETIVERARHALASMATDDHAIALGLTATSLLEGLGAYDRALVMYERMEAALSPEHRLRMARVAQQAGRHGVARRICDEIIQQARASRDAELLACAALVLGAEFRPAAVDPRLVRALEEARAALGPLPPSESVTGLHCRVLARLAAALQPARDPSVPVQMGRDAIAQARAASDDALMLDVLHIAAAALVDYAPMAERLRLAEELLERALRAGDIAKAVRAQGLLALDQLTAGDFAAWDASVDRALELAAQLGEPRHRWRVLLMASMRAVMRGDVALSNGYIVEARALASVTDDPALALSLSAHVGCNGTILHRDDELHRVADVEGVMLDVPEVKYIRGAIRCGVYATIEDRDRAAEAVVPLRDDHTWESPDWFGARIGLALALIGNEKGCRAARAHLAPFSGLELVGGHVGYSYDGPVLRVLAILDSALGDQATAESGLRQALATVQEKGLRTWMAQIHYDLGLVLQRQGTRAAAHVELEAAATLAEDIGMPGLVMRARRAASESGNSSTAVSVPSVPAMPSSTTMVREGDVWLIEHAGRSVRVKDSRGMQLLARLVERPGEELHVLVLASDETGASLHDGGAGDRLDGRARREYKERLSALEEAVAEAERNADLGRLDKLRREKAALESELARAVGAGGRARAAASASERARVNVQRRLRDAIARIADADAALGRFFERAVRTGTYCRFFV
jgi:hypothetical protein